MLSDLRFGWRLLLQRPGFTLVAVLTLSLGIGANTALFSVIDAVLLRPLPYDDADRLVMVWSDNRAEGEASEPMAYDTFADLRRQTDTLKGIAGVSPRWSFVLAGDREPERLSAFFVSAGLLPMLGVRPAHGRSFLETEDRPGGEPVAILSHAFWQRRFGGDPAVVGRAIRLDGRPTTVVGIAPAGFKFLEDVDVYAPLGQNPLVGRGRGVRWVTVAGRLADGRASGDVQSELATIAAQLERQYPDTNTGLGIRVVPLEEEIVGDIRPALLALLGAVGLVLLISCANVANLLLGRAAAREREIAVRTALGSGRGRLVRQFLTESLLLALLGGVAGLLLAGWAVDLLRGFGPQDLPRIETIDIDGRVLAFCLLLSVATGAAFGMAPAIHLAGQNIYESLRDGARSSTAGSSSRLRQALVVLEVTLALVLLVGAGLLIRSFGQLLRVDPGFEPERVLTLQITLQGERFSEPAARDVFYDELFARLSSLPGIERVGATTRLPLGQGVTTSVEVEGRGTPEGERPEVEFRRASTGYFETMGIELREGRSFTDRDAQASLPVAMANEAAARRLWPGESAVGKRVRFGGAASDAPWVTVIGVVEGVRHFGLELDAPPEVYIPFKQGPPTSPLIALRTAVDPASQAAAVRAALRELDTGLVVFDLRPMADIVSESMAQRRFGTWLTGAFAGLALLLAAVGIYGVMSYFVVQRTREIGLRMALGAHPRDVIGLVLRRGLLLTLAGLSLGLTTSWLFSRVLSGMLYGIGATDPSTFAAVAAVLLGVAMLACYLPARRATRVDPLVALRSE